MENSSSKKITALLLSILVLFSSSFIVIDEHYCSDKLEDFSLFGKADKCEMVMPSCNLEDQDLTFSPENCCLNVKQIKPGNIFENVPTFSIISQQLFFFSNINSVNLNHYISLENHTSYFKDYSPPLITRDVLAFVQCYRI